MWKDFHEFWINAKIPVHIIRYEDIVANPKPTIKSLLEFILNVNDIGGTKLDHYLNLAVNEASPQIYKPREGLINGNINKFDKEQLSFILNYTSDFMRKFNYYDLFIEHGAKDEDNYPPSKADREFMTTFNNRSLKQSMKNLYEEDEITSIYINYPALLLRKKSEVYPNGRTSHRFKNALRRKVNIIDKN